MRIQQPIPDRQHRLLPRLAAAQLQDSLHLARHDLDRLQRLLSDATDTLLGHFCGASSQISQWSRLVATPAAPPAHHLQQTLAHLAGAVAALQFQDMASQLIAHTHRRLRNCADRLAADTFDGDGDDADGAAVIEAAPLRPNPVTQDEMDAGSVDLF